ncbi:MAG: YraN family protein [Dehalococcoidia bacterium]|nr:YraN family protein [Dehalococcoidia bacterium]
MADSEQRKGLGAWGESYARDFLLTLGYTIIERNYRSKTGEIDIVAEDNGCLVFVEVKTRSNRRFGGPEESFTARKEARLIALADEYIQKRALQPEDWRLDLVTLELTKGKKPEIQHIRNVTNS